MKFTTTTFLCIAFFTSSISAYPIYKRDVYVPHITSPVEHEIWKIGEKQLVTWNVTDHPAQITNKTGTIKLRRGDVTLNITLAENFDILVGQTEVTVPIVNPGDDYRVVLFGDSGNWSPQFSIQGHVYYVRTNICGIVALDH